MNEDKKIIHSALCELGDYYSRLGGAACPTIMYDSYIPSYIICKLMSLEIEKYTSEAFLRSSKMIAPTVDKKLLAVSATDSELRQVLIEFYEYYNSKMRGAEISSGWLKLGELIKSSL